MLALLFKVLPFTKSFFKPSVTAKIITQNEVKVTFTACSNSEAVFMLYASVQELAKHLGKDKREVLNYMLKMDSKVKQQTKAQEREAKYGKKFKK